MVWQVKAIVGNTPAILQIEAPEESTREDVKYAFTHSLALLNGKVVSVQKFDWRTLKKEKD